MNSAWGFGYGSDNPETVMRSGCHLKHGNLLLLCFSFFLSGKKHMLLQRWYVFMHASLSPGFEVWVLAKPPSRTSWRKESAEKRPMFSFKHVRCRSTVRHGGPRQPSEICREEMFFVGKPVLKRHIAEVKYTCYMLCVQMHIYIYTHMALMFVAMFDVLDRLLMCLWPLYILLWLMWWYIYINIYI